VVDVQVRADDEVDALARVAGLGQVFEEAIDASTRPSAVRNCGRSQPWRSSRSGVASAKKKLPGEAPSISTTRAMRTSPTCQRSTG